MAHVKLEELYGVCDCCYGISCSEECDPDAEWCEDPGGPEYCGGHWEPRTRFIERNYRQFEAEEHLANFDCLYGYWDLTAGGKTRICKYLEIDGHVYCDKRERRADDDSDR